MGWGWPDLEATPNAVVMRVMEHMNALADGQAATATPALPADPVENFRERAKLDFLAAQSEAL